MAKRKAKPVAVATRYAALKQGLLTLAATREGFEGLGALLVETLSGGAVRLMASGDQRGVDAIGDREDGPRRAMQAKRYGDRTQLDINGLLGEMSRASLGFGELESWILVTTQTLMGKDAEDLAALADRSGMSFVAIDWTEVSDVPLLAAGCAAAVDRVRGLLADPAALAELDALAASDLWRPAADRLRRRLTDSGLGFELVQQRALAGLRAIFHKPSEAVALAGPSPALLARAPPVPRIGLSEKLDSWWRTTSPAVVLLGQEGMGKTWASLSALVDLAAAPKGPLPLVISPELSGASRNLLEAVETALARANGDSPVAGRDDAVFWKRKLRLWATAGPARPTILVYVDGLDENDKRWAAFLAPVMEARWNGMFRLLLSSRPETWQGAKDAIGSLMAVEEIEVPLFEPGERDAFLAAQGVDLTHLSAAVLESARHPRTAFHVTRYVSKLPNLKSLTRELLLLEDYANLYEVKHHRPLDPAAFLALVRGLAEGAHQAALSQRAYVVEPGEVVDRAAALTGDDRATMKGVLSELTSGRWCERDETQPHQIRFQPAALPDAVGLALAQRLQGLTAKAARAELERFIEPWGADDLSEQVLRVAGSALILHPRAPSDVCREVLLMWRKRPFRSSAAKDFWRRLHVVRPELFLDLCENDGGGVLSEAGISYLWRDHPSERPLVEQRLFLWATTVPLPAERRQQTPADTRFANHDRLRQLKRLRALKRRGDASYWQSRLGGESVAGRRSPVLMAVNILGMLPRRPFLAHMLGWAMSVEASGRVIGEGVVEWNLRENFEDPEDTYAAVRDLAGAVDDAPDLVKSAVARLLRAGGDPADAVLAAKLSDPPPSWETSSSFTVTDTPFGRRADFDPTPMRSLRSALTALSALASDPAAAPTDALLKDLATQLDAAPAQLVAGWLKSDRQAVLSAWRWFTPQMMGKLDALVEDPATVALAHRLLPVLSEAQRQAALEAGRGEVAGDESERPSEAERVAIAMAQRPFAEQAEILLAASSWPSNYACLLNAPTMDELKAALIAIDFSAPAVQLDWRLTILCDALSNTNAELKEPDDISLDWAAGLGRQEPDVWRAVARLGGMLKSRAAADTLVANNWRCTPEMDQPTRFLGSELLAVVATEALLPRMDDTELARIALHNQALAPKALDLWLEKLTDELTARSTSRSFGGAFWYYRDNEESYARLAAERTDALADLLERVWRDPKTNFSIRTDHGEGPVEPILCALAPYRPELVGEIWQALGTGQRFLRVQSLDRLPARLPAGPVFDVMRRKLIDHALDDAELMACSAAFQQEGHEDLLFAIIEADLAAQRPIRRARGITLAGFLRPTPRAVRLWSEALTEPPEGWLGEVYANANAWFVRGQQAAHWAGLSRGAPHEAEAFAARTVLGEAFDDRELPIWNNARIDGVWRGQWLPYFSDDLSKALKASRDGLQKTRFFATRLSGSLSHEPFPPDVGRNS